MKTKIFNNKMSPLAKVKFAVSRMRKTFLKIGLSKMTAKEIDAEIKTVRKARKRKYIKSLKNHDSR